MFGFEFCISWELNRSGVFFHLVAGFWPLTSAKEGAATSFWYRLSPRSLPWTGGPWLTSSAKNWAFRSASFRLSSTRYLRESPTITCGLCLRRTIGGVDGLTVKANVFNLTWRDFALGLCFLSSLDFFFAIYYFRSLPGFVWACSRGLYGRCGDLCSNMDWMGTKETLILRTRSLRVSPFCVLATVRDFNFLALPRHFVQLTSYIQRETSFLHLDYGHEDSNMKTFYQVSVHFPSPHPPLFPFRESLCVPIDSQWLMQEINLTLRSECLWHSNFDNR